MVTMKWILLQGEDLQAVEGGVLIGRLYFHEGDNSEFKAIRKETEKQQNKD